MLKLALGPTNSQLTTHRWETLALPAVGILTRLCCYYHRDLQSRSVHWTSRPSFCPIGTPSYQTEPIRLSSTVSVAGLSPVHFRGPGPRRVSCYAFFKGWLLLSLPPRCLRFRTPFCLALSQHFGTLTVVWVVPLSERELNPRNPSPGLYGAGVFGVQKGGEASRPLTPRWVLYPASYLPQGLAATNFGGN